MSMSDLKTRKNELGIELINLRDKISKLKAIYDEKKVEYEKVDRRLAMIDGRFTRIEKGRKEVRIKLTKAQLLEIAEELGIKL